MYLFGFPQGLAGGSKETVYNTGQATFHSTTKSTQYATQYQTSQTTVKTTGHHTYGTTTRSTNKSVPYYNPIPVGVKKRSGSFHSWAEYQSFNTCHVVQTYLKIGLTADPTVTYLIRLELWSNLNSYFFGRYPYGNIWALSSPNFPGSGKQTETGGIKDLSEPFSNQITELENFQFTFGQLGNARLQLNDRDANNRYSLTIVKGPDDGCPYFFADYENVSSAYRMRNTSYSTSLGITNFETNGTTYFQTAHNTSHNTTYDTYYQTYHPTSHITYG